MSQLAERLGMTPRVLDKLKQFAAVFDPEEVARLVAASRADGEPLAWSHVRELLDVGDKEERERLIGLAITGDWTSDRLAQAARMHKGRPTRGGGPKPVPAGDLEGLVGQMTRFLDEWQKRHDRAWKRSASPYFRAGSYLAYKTGVVSLSLLICIYGGGAMSQGAIQG